jgi:chromosome partitioning protein
VPAIGTTLNLLKLTQAVNRSVILLNAAPPRGGITDTAAAGLAEIITVAPVRLHHRIAYSHAINSGHSVEEYDPHGKAAQEIRALYKWIMIA